MDLALLILVPVVTTAIISLGALAFRYFARGIKSSIRDDIKAHLIPNGGSSLADRLTKVEQAVEKLTESAKETGCLPGCPVRNGYWPTGTPAPWAAPHVSYGSPPTWTTNTPLGSQPNTPMPVFLPPTSS